MYIPDHGNTPGSHNNPLATADVIFNDNNTQYSYTLAFFPKGDHTVTLTCDAELDEENTDDDVLFTQTDNISVIAGQTATKDINP